MRNTAYPKIILFLLFIAGSSSAFAQVSLRLNNPVVVSSGNKFLFEENNTSLHGLNKINFSNAGLMSAAASTSVDPDIKIYSGFGDNILNSFKGNNAYLHLAAVASTALIITTNTDYYVHKYFNEHEGFGDAARPVIRMGNYFPFIIGGSLYAYGKLGKDNQAVGASFAVLQSTLLAFGYNSLLKAITGRPNPNWREEQDMKELSKTFRFGFLRGGVFWGWPSGHTSSTMAVVSALTNFYPNKTWLKIVGYSYVAYMAFGVSSLNRGSMHWFSDAIAALFTAYAIGSTVGKFYRSKFTEAENEMNNSAQSIPVFSFMISF